MSRQPGTDPIQGAPRPLEPGCATGILFSSCPAFSLLFGAQRRENEHLLGAGHGDIEQTQLLRAGLSDLLLFGQPEAEARIAAARVGRMDPAAHSNDVNEAAFLLSVVKV